jgi:hypothetical protein
MGHAGEGQVVARMLSSARDQAAAFEQAGVDELVFDPTVADLDQVDGLADAVTERSGAA